MEENVVRRNVLHTSSYVLRPTFRCSIDGSPGSTEMIEEAGDHGVGDLGAICERIMTGALDDC